MLLRGWARWMEWGGWDTMLECQFWVGGGLLAVWDCYTERVGDAILSRVTDWTLAVFCLILIIHVIILCSLFLMFTVLP